MGSVAVEPFPLGWGVESMTFIRVKTELPNGITEMQLKTGLILHEGNLIASMPTGHCLVALEMLQ